MANQNNEISTKIMLQLIGSGKDNIRIDYDNLFHAIISGKPQIARRRIAHAIGLLLMLIAVVGMVVYSAVFYVQNVLLDKPDMEVNQFGALVRKSYNSEYAMFLFDASEPWAASGVQVQDGDRVFISASGAFHTKISELIAAAENNQWADRRAEKIGHLDKMDTQSMYRYVYMTSPLVNESNPPHAVDIQNLKVALPSGSGKTKPSLFGELLLQVIPEYQMRVNSHQDSTCTYAISRPHENRKPHKQSVQIRQNGVLSFCVNDYNPYNNIGQVLVVMEIYRKQTRVNAFWKMFRGQLMDYPYFWYNYLKHRGSSWISTPVWNMILGLGLALTVIIECLLLCGVICYLPSLFLKETWTKIGRRQNKK